VSDLSRLTLDPEVFAHQFNRRPFFIEHQLAGHPLFALPRLVALAQSLPPDEVEYNAGNVPVNADYRQTPRTGLGVAETIRRIEECGSWMVLKRVERDPEYKALLDELLDQIKPHADRLHPGMRDRQGFIFITSPGSVTPFHMDNEYNFLLQIRGEKTVHMWDPNDRLVLPEETIEQFHGDFVHRNLTFRDEFMATAWVLPLGPGRGLHFPVNAPHWIKNGDGVSISFSITFDGDPAHQRKLVYILNHRLRKLGLRPQPYGAWPARDRLKALGFASYLKVRRRLAAVTGRPPDQTDQPPPQPPASPTQTAQPPRQAAEATPAAPP
jgi:hypothetical protein